MSVLITPEFTSDVRLLALGVDAALLYVCILARSNVAGLLEVGARMSGGSDVDDLSGLPMVCPFMASDPSRLNSALVALETNRLVIRYTTERGHVMLWAPKKLKHNTGAKLARPITDKLPDRDTLRAGLDVCPEWIAGYALIGSGLKTDANTRMPGHIVSAILEAGATPPRCVESDTDGEGSIEVDMLALHYPEALRGRARGGWLRWVREGLVKYPASYVAVSLRRAAGAIEPNTTRLVNAYRRDHTSALDRPPGYETDVDWLASGGYHGVRCDRCGRSHAKQGGATCYACGHESTTTENWED